MFARHVVVRLKAKAAPEFTRLMEKEIIPMLRKQKGFLDEIVFISPDLTEAVGNSFWETKADAEAYSRKGYPEVIKSLVTVVAGTPTVGTANVSNSTFHKFAARNGAYAISGSDEGCATLYSRFTCSDHLLWGRASSSKSKSYAKTKRTRNLCAG